MSYLPVEQYKRAWIFRHKDLPISDEDLAQIKPLAEARAEQVWTQQISNRCNHPSLFNADDWASKADTWLETDHWQQRWESEENALPDILSEHLQWEDDTVVWFCYSSEHVIETSWAIFRQHWKNFLFFDDGPILIGRKRKQVVQFHQTGNYRIGNRK